MSGLPLRRFGSVSLDELLAEAELLTRIDRKYVLRYEEVLALLGEVSPRTRVLTIDGRRTFNYESVYFDTPDLLSYRQTATSRRHRFKVRTRSYLDTDRAFLEVKVRGTREITVKERMRYDVSARDRLTEPGRSYAEQTLAEQGMESGVAEDLGPTLLTRYERATLLPPEPGVRVTIDTDLAWTDGERAFSVPGLVIVETKSDRHSTGVDRLLWRSRHRPDSISKYATGLAALHDDLPSSKWTRVLRRHFISKETTCAA